MEEEESGENVVEPGKGQLAEAEGSGLLGPSAVGTCKHLGIDSFAYLREALPVLFALGEKPTAERLLDWLPDRWQVQRQR